MMTLQNRSPAVYRASASADTGQERANRRRGRAEPWCIAAQPEAHVKRCDGASSGVSADEVLKLGSQRARPAQDLRVRYAGSSKQRVEMLAHRGRKQTTALDGCVNETLLAWMRDAIQGEEDIEVARQQRRDSVIHAHEIPTCDGLLQLAPIRGLRLSQQRQIQSDDGMA